MTHRVLVLNGPNLGMTGRREPEIYGKETLADVKRNVRQRAEQHGIEIRWEQSNHEGVLIDILEEEHERAHACILNGGALTHTSLALADAVRAFAKPVVEVHLSNIHAREPFRHTSLTAAAARGVIAGLGAQGYVLAVDALAQILEATPKRSRTA